MRKREEPVAGHRGRKVPGIFCGAFGGRNVRHLRTSVLGACGLKDGEGGRVCRTQSAKGRGCRATLCPAASGTIGGLKPQSNAVRSAFWKQRTDWKRDKESGEKTTASVHT